MKIKIFLSVFFVFLFLASVNALTITIPNIVYYRFSLPLNVPFQINNSGAYNVTACFHSVYSLKQTCQKYYCLDDCYGNLTINSEIALTDYVVKFEINNKSYTNNFKVSLLSSPEVNVKISDIMTLKNSVSFNLFMNVFWHSPVEYTIKVFDPKLRYENRFIISRQFNRTIVVPSSSSLLLLEIFYHNKLLYKKSLSISRVAPISLPQNSGNNEGSKGKQNNALNPISSYVSEQVKQLNHFVKPGMPVKWNKIVRFRKKVNYLFKLGSDQKIVRKIIHRKNSQYFQPGDFINLTYETPAPRLRQIKIARGKFKVLLSSRYHYHRIITQANITPISINEKKSIHLYWFVNGKKVEETHNKSFNLTYITKGNQIVALQWITPHTSNQTFLISITVLNAQSYPIVTGRWTVAFNTTGVGNLTITAINGTTYAEYYNDNKNTQNDLVIKQLRCGNQTLFDKDNKIFNKNDYLVLTNGSIVHLNSSLDNLSLPIRSFLFVNYSCNDTGYWTVEPITSGHHYQEFQFSDSQASVSGFAQNNAQAINISLYTDKTLYIVGTPIFLNGTMTYYSGGVWYNLTNNRYQVWLNSTLINGPIWLYYNWNYRESFTVNSQVAVTDYQLELVLNSSNFDYSNAKSDGSDIRFSYRNGTVVPYWIQLWNTSGNSYIWIKVNLSAGDNYFYMYYGNPDAVSESNGSQVFLFFDNFENWNGWTTYSSGNVVQDSTRAYQGTYSAHKINNNDPNGAYKELPQSIGRNVILEFWVNRNSAYSGGAYDRVGLIDDSGNGYGWVFSHGSNHYIRIDQRNSYKGKVLNSASATDYKDKWVFARFYVLSDGTIESQRYVNGVLNGDVTTSDTTYSTFTRVYIFGGYDYWVDLLRLRKYLSTVPTVTYGSVFSNQKTNGSGFYNYSFNAPLQQGEYLLKVNTTYDGAYGFNETTIYVKSNASWVPKYDTFNGSTTMFGVFYNETTIQNVCQPVLEKTAYGKIVWNNCVNATSQDFDSNVLMGTNWIFLNTSNLDTSFNSSANLTFYHVYQENPVPLYNGNLCTFCSVIDYSNNIFSFQVPHFTNYSVAPGSTLSTWDDSSDEKVYVNQQDNFYANYSLDNGTSIDDLNYGGSCNISFYNGSWTIPVSMEYNSTDQLWHYNRSFSSDQYTQYNVSCYSSFTTYSLSENHSMDIRSELTQGCDDTVCSDWWSCDYTTIQDAVDNAFSGDVICVEPGEYDENVTVDNDVTIIAENQTNMPQVKGSFNLTVDDAAVLFMNISDGKSFSCSSGSCISGIFLNANNVSVSDNYFSNLSLSNAFGIYGSSSNSYISENDFNILKSNSRAIFLKNSYNDTIFKNTISLQDGNGIELKDSKNITINETDVNVNSGNGILLNDTNNSLITSSTIPTDTSISFINSDNNTCYSSTFSSIQVNGGTNYVVVSDFNESKISVLAGMLFVQWFFDANVYDSSGNPLSNSQGNTLVNATDNGLYTSNPTSSFSEPTNASGSIPQQTLTEFVQNSSGRFYFTNYSVTASSYFASQTKQLNLTASKTYNFYLAIQNTNLSVWDDSDVNKYTTEQVHFSANYTFVNSTPVQGYNALCTIAFYDGSWSDRFNMTFNSTSDLWQYNRSFSTNTYSGYNVSCDSDYPYSYSSVLNPISISYLTNLTNHTQDVMRLNQLDFIYANYSYVNGEVYNVNINIEIEHNSVTQTYPMTYNSSLDLYTFSFTPTSTGYYNYTITASRSGYESQTIHSHFYVLTVRENISTNQSSYFPGDIAKITVCGQYYNGTDWVGAVNGGGSVEFNNSDLIAYPGWLYRENLTINNINGNLTDYQVEIDLNSSNVGANFNWSNNASLRFSWFNYSAHRDVPLPYWIQSWDPSGQSAIVWIKMPFLVNGSSTLYMYYGNPNATSESNGDNVFLFFDGFNETSLDSSKWDVYNAPSTYSVSNGILSMWSNWGGCCDGSCIYNHFNSKVSFAPPFVVETRFEVTGSVSLSSATQICYHTIFDNNDAAGISSSSNGFVFNIAGSNTKYTYDFPALDTWYITKETFLPNEITTQTSYYEAGYSYSGTLDSSGPIGLAGDTDLSDGYDNVDWLFVRKYVSNPFTVDYGNQQNIHFSPTCFTINYTIPEVSGYVNISTNMTYLGMFATNFTTILVKYGLWWMPKYDTFNGTTTNFDNYNETTIQNVCQPVLEKTAYGKIVWNNCVNATAQDFDSNVGISSRNISVNAENLDSSFNSSANLTYYNISFDNPLVLEDGKPCSDCTFISYSGTNYSVQVQHFTSYTVTENNSLTIWDDSDNEHVFSGDNDFFYANYTFTNGTAVDNDTYNGSCEITIYNGTWSNEMNMTYNSSSGLWQYNKTVDIYDTLFNVSCYSTFTQENMSASDNITVVGYSVKYTYNLLPPSNLTIFILLGKNLTAYLATHGNISSSPLYDYNYTSSDYNVFVWQNVTNETITTNSSGLWSIE